MSGLLAGSDDYARGFRRILVLLIALVVVPTAILLVIGILLLVFWQGEFNLLLGILVVTLVAALVTGAVLSIVFLRREANLSKLQLDFVSKVSHELRTPLTSIRMFVEMLQMKRITDPNEVAMALDVLAKETGRLTDRIERLLDWGRMEAGRRTYDRQIDDPVAVAKEALLAFETNTFGRSVPVEFFAESDLPKVNADRGALVDAIVNLLSNAYKYTGDEKRISLRVTHADKTIRFAVIDNGIGVPKAEHRRIFEKFHRGDDRLSRSVEGSGLGLAIVRHVVLAHGGHVGLESTQGKGSTFTIVLPVASTNELRESARFAEKANEASEPELEAGGDPS